MRSNKMNNLSVFKVFVLILLSISSTILYAEQEALSGSASFRERIALPPNAVFTATLEDVSLMDVPSVTLGTVSIDEAVKTPIFFFINYNRDDIKLGRRYNVRGRITVDGKLKFITDTMHPVFTGKDSNLLNLKLKMLKP